MKITYKKLQVTFQANTSTNKSQTEKKLVNSEKKSEVLNV